MCRVLLFDNDQEDGEGELLFLNEWENTEHDVGTDVTTKKKKKKKDRSTNRGSGGEEKQKEKKHGCGRTGCTLKWKRRKIRNPMCRVY